MTAPVALVTGGAGGIGAATCRALAARGAFVWVAGRTPERCSALVEELRAAGHDARALALDVTDAAGLADALAPLGERGPVTWLVNNAGIVETQPVTSERADDAHAERLMQVNYHGARRLTQALLPGMRAAGGGRVVQVASSAALQGYAYVAAYAASKHALLGWSRSAALDLAREGVGVQVVCPHFVDTPMTTSGAESVARRTGKPVDEVQRAYADLNPSGVLLTPEEVAGRVLELLEDERTGRVLELPGDGQVRVVEEGRTLRPARG